MDRLELFEIADPKALALIASEEFQKLAGRSPNLEFDLLAPFSNCLQLALDGKAKAVVVQREVIDPDFMAEFTAYYSRQFAQVRRHCSRLHFFTEAAKGREALDFLDDGSAQKSYLGFVTLRPVSRTPIGATIFNQVLAGDFVKSLDSFPVHIGGVEFTVRGTPFMQQDNAVGACAQASIWMALRTMRKREGDRAHDPAQITDAATKYVIGGRKLPNREGLHQFQMTEAIRAAGYSPHVLAFSGTDDADDDHRIEKIHPYVESEIPVIAILDTGNQIAHAVVIVGHGWESAPARIVKRQLSDGANPITAALGCSWAHDLIINNDNTGPYRRLGRALKDGYSLKNLVTAIPLLPSDVFMTGEEASAVTGGIVGDVLKSLGSADVQNIADQLTLRLLLIEKWRLRAWAAKNKLPAALSKEVRSMVLPRRVWLLEVHDKTTYGDHQKNRHDSVIGIILLDSTSDSNLNAVLLQYWNYSVLRKAKTPSVLMTRDANGSKATKVDSDALLPAFRE